MAIKNSIVAGLPDITSPITLRVGQADRIERSDTLDCDLPDGADEFRLLQTMFPGGQLTVDGVTLSGGCADQADIDGDRIGDACDLCRGDNATGDADGDRVCADLDVDDSDPTLGIAGSIFMDGFENGDTMAWTTTVP